MLYTTDSFTMSKLRCRIIQWALDIELHLILHANITSTTSGTSCNNQSIGHATDHVVHSQQLAEVLLCHADTKQHRLFREVPSKADKACAITVVLSQSSIMVAYCKCALDQTACSHVS